MSPAAVRPALSIAVPVHDEEAVLVAFHARLAAVLDTLACDAEIIYVNDGSADGSWSVLEELHRNDPRVSVIDLSRQFGKEAAMSAGLDEAAGDAKGRSR